MRRICPFFSRRRCGSERLVWAGLGMSASPHHRDLVRLYDVLSELGDRVGRRMLNECDGRMNWSSRGVYFFFETGESRPDGTTPHVVRVGTHAVSAGSKTTLWNRLSTHRGTRSGGGNHRGSIFRLWVGTALLNEFTRFNEGHKLGRILTCGSEAVLKG